MEIGPGRVELLINNSRTAIMRPGEVTPEGVRFKSMPANNAEAEANGFTQRLLLGQRIEPMAMLLAGANGH